MFGRNKKKPDSVPASELAEDAPWVRAGKQHDDKLIRPYAQAANWRMFAFFLLLLLAGAIGGVIVIGSKSKFVPFMVEVDKLGRTIAVRALDGGDAIADFGKMDYREIFELIENLRTVSSDIGANNKHLEDGFSRLRGAAASYVRTELRKAPPNEVGASKTVQVLVKTAFPISGASNTWQVEWEEHSYGGDGEAIGVEKWKASVSFTFDPSDKEEVFRKNPLGFFVDNLNWARVI